MTTAGPDLFGPAFLRASAHRDLKKDGGALGPANPAVYCSITDGAKSSSTFISRGVSPCSNEYWAAVSSVFRLAAMPWTMMGVARALRASGGSSPVSR